MLRVIQQGPERASSTLVGEAEVAMSGDLHPPERDEVREFRWMGEHGRLDFEPAPGLRFLELPVFSNFHDLSQELTVATDGQSVPYPLCHGWQTLSHPLAAGAGDALLAVNKIFPRSHYPGDPRTLAVRLGAARLHGDPERHRAIAAVQDNRILNFREMVAGETVLESTPPALGIDLHGACNVKPPCVYCDWDAFKAQEGDFVDAPFTRETLEEWGPFFDNADSLINCGIGEPFMMKNLDELLDIFGARGKMLEMATNGQILTDKNIDRLIGRRVGLFVSLDAATPETYAQLRNDTLPKILDNLRRLIAAKGGRGPYPKVFLIFMPMRVNVHELEAFVELCAELDVDEMVLRPLNYSDEMGLEWERAGHHFVYEKELLPFRELVRISGRAAELCRRHGVPLTDQLDFGDASMEDYFPEDYSDGRRGIETEEITAATPAGQESPPPAPADGSQAVALEVDVAAGEREESDSLGDPALPICTEPWKHLYILRRGVVPCCYGQKPLAPMDRWESVWNSQPLQEIRADLAAGRLHRYCLDSPACPIVQKRLHGGRLPALQALPLRLQAVLHRLDRLAFGAPGKAYRGVRWVTSRAWRAVREPDYAREHLRRLLRPRRSDTRAPGAD